MLPKTGVEWAICAVGTVAFWAIVWVLLAFGTIFF